MWWNIYRVDAYVYLNFLFQLDSRAFSNLNVKKHNYSEVDKLYLDNNQLDSLPEKLLKMRLKVRFSARNNKLTTVSFSLTHFTMASLYSIRPYPHMILISFHFSCRYPSSFPGTSWKRRVWSSCRITRGNVPALVKSLIWYVNTRHCIGD